MYRFQLILLLTTFYLSTTYASDKCSIYGIVQSEDGPVPGAVIRIEGTTLGIVSDEKGQFEIENIPSGTIKVNIQSMGYKNETRIVQLEKGERKELKIALEIDHIMINGVVVSATRNAVDRSEAPVVVNVINDRIFSATQSVSLSEGLNFQPGLRLETNCQNCGFTQVRMNGLEGQYSQVLINSRPIFSALQGVYGLEQIPVNMIERVEVVRGGGSALFGANSIAGTINIITKEPVENTFQVATNNALIGNQAFDWNINANTSLVSEDLMNGLTLYAMHRDRNYYDANGDGFSEMTQLNNNTFGGMGYFKPNSFSKLSLDFHSINEFRRGGNLFDRPPHETDITEQLEHNIIGGGISYELYSKNYNHKWAFYLSGQKTKRKSYYGGGGNVDVPILNKNSNHLDSLHYLSAIQAKEKATKYYGNTDDLSWVGGIQYNGTLDEITFTGGIEQTYNQVEDRMPGYERIIDQKATNTGIYAQLEFKPVYNLSLLTGLRFDYTQIQGNYLLFGQNNQTSFKTPVLNPRINILYKPKQNTQLRLGYARGFRAPQAFDEDLHIETVGGQAQFVKMSNDLNKETSDALTASIDWNSRIGRSQFNLLVEGFYTKLNGPFINVGLVEGDANNPRVSEKQNSEENALVNGANIEFRLATSSKYQFQLGGTIQSAKYDSPILLYNFEKEDRKPIYDDRIMRTPNYYGYFVNTWMPNEHLEFNISGVYTGSMPQPYEGNTRPIEIRNTKDFIELNIKINYAIHLGEELVLDLSGGVQNIFNSYQDDFDIGATRDANYIYGPSRPRTYFLGLAIKNFE